MLATLGGALALASGLAVLLLPLLLPELSRPRDAAWGAVVLLLGLVLVTSADRLTGSPMLGVLCGGLLIGRLGLEVGQGRWRLLSPEEQARLRSTERWQSALQQLTTTAAGLGSLLQAQLSVLTTWLGERRQPRTTSKRWVRPEPAAAPAPISDPAASESVPEPEPEPEPESVQEPEPVPESATAPGPADPVAVVSSFAEIDALIEASSKPAAAPAADEAG
jgi:hypothetical protein